MLQNLSVDEIYRFAEIDTSLLMLTPHGFKRYEDFSAFVLTRLKSILLSMEEGKNLRQHDGEDRLTHEICTILNQTGLRASHGEIHGGNTDLLIKWSNFSFIAEAKFDDSYAYVCEGLKQLVDRYASPSITSSHGALLIFFRTYAYADFFAELFDSKISNYITFIIKHGDCDLNERAKTLTCFHSATGTTYLVNLIPLVLTHYPSDKSALRSVVHQELRSERQARKNAGDNE